VIGSILAGIWRLRPPRNPSLNGQPTANSDSAVEAG